MPPEFLFVNLSNSELNAFIKGLAHKGHCRPSVHLSLTIYVPLTSGLGPVSFPPTSHSSCQEHSSGERFNMVPGRLDGRLRKGVGCYARWAVLWYPTALRRYEVQSSNHTNDQRQYSIFLPGAFSALPVAKLMLFNIKRRKKTFFDVIKAPD